MARRKQLSEKQVDMIVALYEKFRAVQSWYWEHLVEWRDQVLKAAGAAKRARAAFDALDVARGVFPPWIESESDRELLAGLSSGDFAAAGSEQGEDRGLGEAEVFAGKELEFHLEQANELMKSVLATCELADRVEEATAAVRMVAGDHTAPARRGPPADPELAVGFIARKAGVPAEWVQEVIDEHFGGPKGRASGKLARKMRRLEERAASEREGKK